METMEVTITGSTMLLMHSARLMNPRDEIVKEMKKITAKRKKSDDDLMRLAELEHAGGMYYDPKLGPYIPAECIEATLKEAAKLQKKGRDCDRGLRCTEDRYKLDYTGPRKIKDLWKDDRFVDMRAARVSGRGVMRCRPCFPSGWKVKFTLAYNEAIWDRDTLKTVVKQAGEMVGLCDFRTRYGRFTAEVA